MIYCPKWKLRNGKSFWKFFLPNWSWARQPLSSARWTLLYPFQMLSAKQDSSNSHLLTSFGMTRPGIEPTTSRLWGGCSTDWANTHGNCKMICVHVYYTKMGIRIRLHLKLWLKNVLCRQVRHGQVRHNFAWRTWLLYAKVMSVTDKVMSVTVRQVRHGQFFFLINV